VKPAIVIEKFLLPGRGSTVCIWVAKGKVLALVGASRTSGRHGIVLSGEFRFLLEAGLDGGKRKLMNEKHRKSDVCGVAGGGGGANRS